MYTFFKILMPDVQKIMYRLLGILPDRERQTMVDSSALYVTLRDDYDISRLKYLRLISRLIKLDVMVKNKVYYTDGSNPKTYLFVNAEQLLRVFNVTIIGYHVYDRNLQLISDSMCDTLHNTLYNLGMSKYRNLLNSNFKIQCNSSMPRHFTIRKDGQITFTPAHKPTLVNPQTQKWGIDRYRTQIKHGRAIKTIFNTIGYDIPASDLEKINNELKSQLVFCADFDVVSGENIRRFYHYSNYASGNLGSLNESCMRYDSCSNYMDVYVSNPDKVKMLIAKKPNTDYIIGRALLWVTDQKNHIMDRIYGTEITVSAFKQWAHNNGYWHKQLQNYSSYDFVTSTGQIIEDEQTVTLKGNHEYYPYMDTFKYADNVKSDTMILSTRNGNHCLTSTEGYMDDNLVQTQCGTHIDRDEAVYCERFGDYYRPQNATWSDYEDDYIPNGEYIETYCNQILWSDSDDYREAQDTLEYHLYDDVTFSIADDYWLYNRVFECPISGYCDSDNTHSFVFATRTFRCHQSFDLDYLRDKDYITQVEYESYPR